MRDVRTLDLLPSSIDLIDTQDRLVLMPAGQFHTKNPTDILRRAIQKIIDTYDYVLIDCPPNLGIITLNGLRIAAGYIIPTIPDVLSTYGIPQIVRRVAHFSEDIGQTIEPFGIAVCKYEQRSRVHRRILQGLRSGTIKVSESGPIRVFQHVIPQRTELSDSAEFTPVNTLRQKYGYRDEYVSYLGLTQEIDETVGVSA